MNSILHSPRLVSRISRARILGTLALLGIASVSPLLGAEPVGPVVNSAPAANSGCDSCPVANPRIDGVDSGCGDGCGEARWGQWGPIPWQSLNQGESIGPPRSPQYPGNYQVRVDDILEMRFLSTRTQSAHSYRLQIGDKLKIESVTDANINRDVTIQPDGMIALFLVDEVHVAGLTFQELRQKLFEAYTRKDYKPAAFQITITPVATNTRLDDLMIAITNRFTAGGQSQLLRVAPDGTVSLIKLGRVCVQGMTLDEVKWEVNARYADYVDGLEVTPILATKAPHYCFVLGEVKTPGRFQMESPTTVSMALAMAGSWQLGGNLRQVVVFRRAEDWRLLATKLDIRGPLYGKRPTPADEIFLRDSDIVVVPKSAIQQTDDLLELLFTRGLYRVTPFGISTTFAGNGAAVTTAVGGFQ